MNSGRHSINEKKPELLNWHLTNKSITEIVITGGEPLLINDLDKIVKKLSLSGKNITLYTNGLLLNSQIIKLLKKAGLKKIRVSIDSAISIINGRTMSIEKAVEMGKICVKNGILFELGVTIIPNMNDSLSHILPIKEFCLKNNFTFSISPYFPSYPNEKLTPLTKNALDILMEFKYLESIIDKINNSNNLNNENNKCSALTDVLAILPDGKISPCDNLAGAIQSEKSILDYDLEYIIKHEDKINFYKKHNINKLKHCSACNYLKYCNGGCRAIAYYYKDEFDCDIFTKQKFDYCFENMSKLE